MTSDTHRTVATSIVAVQIVLITVAGGILLVLGWRIAPMLEKERELTRDIDRKTVQLGVLKAQEDQYLKTLEQLQNAIHQQGSPELKAAAGRIPFWQQVAIKATAVRTGPKSASGDDLYRITVWIEGAKSVLERIQKVEYHFDDPSYHPPRKFGTDPNNGFAISYTGWGCLSSVRVTAVRRDADMTTTNFNLCAALGW